MNPKDMTNEELANVLDAICLTGISPTRTEKECLYEAATRLRKTQDQQDSK